LTSAHKAENSTLYNIAHNRGSVHVGTRQSLRFKKKKKTVGATQEVQKQYCIEKKI